MDLFGTGRSRWAAPIGLVITVLLAALAFWLLAKVALAHKPDRFWMVLGCWAIITLTAFIFGNVLFFLINRIWPNEVQAALAFSIFWGISAGSAVLVSIFFIYQSDSVRQSHAFIASVGGAVVGWLLGMYFSPQGASEEQEFGKIKAAIAAVASGYTLKGLQDFAFTKGNEHYQIYLVLSAITAALTAATIYNTRAYGNRGVRISFDTKFADKADPKKIEATTKAEVPFRAAVSGPDDTSVRWIVVPDPITAEVFGEIEWGKFTAKLKGRSAPVKCQVKAESISDPRLCDVVDVTITS